MDPGPRQAGPGEGPGAGPVMSGLESSLPHSDPPCLIVEDSQPDSIGIEDDPETSYRALLTKRLTTLQPRDSSPVLEVISSSVGSRSQSQPVINEMNPTFEESEILDVSERKRCSEEMGSREESQCLTHEEGASQFGFLELSQSQDIGSEPVQNETRTRPDESSGSLGPKTSPKTRISVEALLHSQVQDKKNQDQEEMMSSQEDLFDKADPAQHSSTPSRSLALLQLSGCVQGTLVHNSLSQGSVDFVAPTPDNFTPVIIPSSPTDLPSHGDDPMDSSLPPTGQSERRDSGPASSTPVSQNTPGFELERPLSVPSQPDFSHDVFVPTQSQDNTSHSSAPSKPSAPASSSAPAPSSAPGGFSQSSLNLCINTEVQEEDEEATQIEPMDEETTPQKPASNSQNSQKPSTHSQNSAQKNSDPDQAEKSQSSIIRLSQEAKSQQEKPKQRPKSNPNSQECQMLNVNEKSATNTSQGSAKANSQPTPESAAGSLIKVLNVDCEKTARNVSLVSTKANSQPTGSVVKEFNVDYEKITKSLSQCRTKANGQPTKSVTDMIVNEAVLDQPQAKLKNVDHNQKSQGSTKANSQTIGSVEEIVIASQSQRSNGNGKLSPQKMSGSPSKNQITEEAEETEKGETFGLVLSQSEMLTHGGGGGDGGEKMVSDRKDKREASGGKSLDSSGDISFHFTLPKEGELIGPSVSATPPQISQLKQSLRHSTPIEMNLLSQNSDVSAGSDIMAEGSDVTVEGADGKLSLRMKPATPVEEGSSERFSLQRPSLGEDVSAGPTSKSVHSPSVFSRIRQVHRTPADNTCPLRSPLFTSAQRNTNQSNSLPNSQSDPSMQEVTSHAHSSTANENGGKNLSQNAPGTANSLDKTDPETPLPRRTGPAHRRHVRTIQEVRTTVTRIITDVYYEDGKEVDRTVTQESDEPVVQFQVMDVSPSRTGNSSVTSGDLADISSSICTTGTTSSSGTGPTSTERPKFLPPPNRGVKTNRAPPAVSDPVSQVSDLAGSSPDPQSSSGSSFVGLRVVAKWSSNGYFYSGRIIQDFGVQPGPGSGSSPGSGPGENRFRLRFDDGYECELWARDILLCDPIPLETEVTALNQDQTYCTGVVMAHKLEGSELQYCVERGDHRLWFPRSSVILSLDQGNRLRDKHSLGPYQPPPALGKAADISLDNLVEGKRKRRGAQSGLATPTRSPRAPRSKPGPSPGPNPGSKRKLGSDGTPAAKRGRRGAVHQVTALNTSDSDPPLVSCDHAPGACDASCDLTATHGPRPQNTTLFENFVFLLTSSSERDRLSNRQDNEELVQTGPYNKLYTESQLQSGGGTVLKEFNHQQCEAAFQSLLIADQHCCNRPYLLCVVSGVPCVSHLWVRDCCRENTLLNYRNYLLPAGAGPGGGVREWRPHRSPFKSLRVLLLLKDQVEFWSELVELGGGTALVRSPEDHTELHTGSADVLVLEPGLDPAPVSGSDLPQVSVDWIIDCVVCGETLDFSGSSFGLDLSSSSSS
ncbi:TP53-binding protein 1 isoform X2 [Periophthalmus magnuspinnatus]|uniref:TP53-binding protein 1 isoform X2 n=1 Tax=Periophthalmus magnuspinnatus TaxID=409849 RepID=UPI002436F407|nr:TP53-binding protein 1 isoform X2 [Periophthalmus magnuspinnatus]